MAGTAATTATEALSHGGIDLLQVVALLGAGVIAVPLFKRLGLSSVLGYLAAGLVVGPFGLRVVSDPEAVLQAAELGVVLFLFIIGLEMEPTRLWALRKQIFGLGVLQVVLCGTLLTLAGIYVLGLSPVVAFIAGMGFTLTSTAIVAQLLAERGDINTPGGQKIISILLLEDLSIVPLFAILALLVPDNGGGHDAGSRWLSVGIAAASVVVVVFAGRWVLNPVFRILAGARAREVMTAAALLVVLGAALIMQAGGLSMAMGAFVAGVLLSTSTFRHQLEADVEPFRGLLLGLFFLAVGMSLDLDVVARNWQVILAAVAVFLVVKGVAVFGLARVLRSKTDEALERALLMAQGGEFAFVLFTTAAGEGLLGAETNGVLTAVVIFSMVLTPFSVMLLKLLPRPQPSFDGVDQIPDGLHGDVLVIGFGRFGQIAVQALIAKRHKVSIIDDDTDMIRAAAAFGMKVYYGDGTRLDILHAAGAGSVDLILVCVDKKEAATRIVQLVKSEFPLAKVFARAFDRGHAIELVKLDVDFQIRELFESALVFGGEALKVLGSDSDEVAQVLAGVRSRDRERFEAQVVGGLSAGRDLLLSNADEQAREAGVTPPASADDATREDENV